MSVPGVRMPPLSHCHPRGNGPALLGRDWLASLKLDWKRIFAVHAHKTLDEVLESHKEVFEDGLGTAAAIHVDPAAMPQFFKATILT